MSCYSKLARRQAPENSDSGCLNRPAASQKVKTRQKLWECHKIVKFLWEAYHVGIREPAKIGLKILPTGTRIVLRRLKK